MAIILRYFPGLTFRTSEINMFAEGIHLYLVSKGKANPNANTPTNTLSRTITKELRDKYKLIDNNNGVWTILDRERMSKLVGTIPDDFPQF